MNARNPAVALSAGVVAFLVVGVAVTEILSTRIWPSAVVGLPARILAGVVGTLTAYYLLAARSQE